jgi:ubiquinone biosynthesis protein
MLVATGLRDAALLREAVGEVAEVGDEVDPDALERALSRFLAAHVGSGSAIGASAIHDLLLLLNRFGISVPAELTTFSRALVVLEGTLGALVPGYQLGDHARELAEEWAVEPASGSLEDTVRDELLGLLPVLRRLPRRVDRVADLLERGALTTRVSLFAQPDDAALVTRLVNRFTMGFLGAVLGVISAMLLGTERGPVLADGTQLLHVLGVVGLGCGAVLMLRVVAAIVRDGLN